MCKQLTERGKTKYGGVLPCRLPPGRSGYAGEKLWNYAFRGDETFPLIEAQIREKYPDVRFVSFERFGNFHDPSEEEKMMAELPDKLKRFHCDAVLVGNGC